MKKIFLSVFIVASFNLVHAMEKKTDRAASPRDMFICGALAGAAAGGGLVEAVGYAVRSGHHKDIVGFARRYPGIAAVGVTAIVGAGVLCGYAFESITGEPRAKTAS